MCHCVLSFSREQCTILLLREKVVCRLAGIPSGLTHSPPQTRVSSYCVVEMPSAAHVVGPVPLFSSELSLACSPPCVLAFGVGKNVPLSARSLVKMCYLIVVPRLST
ncbi:uncharacterized protein TM35_000331030 [Trypanosoma theileri]|uniref:Uncharacterized protein n=1 Tax=Trypanosoma theileri TaxID=67003 RepID=A0A1X0NLQ4_9TRYP|nr:uncharacterized protein TM35_000331030 [Trypanosoma theileri]ORC85646.1 hypothetical protein TM35_000331030 [Trypanosoma theileri]